MKSSATPTTEATPVEPPVARVRPQGSDQLAAHLATALIALCGCVLTLAFYRWDYNVQVFFLMLGWVAVVISGRALWASVIAAASDEGPDDDFDVIDTERDELERDKRLLLKAIKEVEFDRDTGKLTDQEADDFTRVYRARAIAIIKKLELTPEAREQLPIRDVIERELAARLGEPEPAPVAEAAAAAAASSATPATEPPATESPVVKATSPAPAAPPIVRVVDDGDDGDGDDGDGDGGAATSDALACWVCSTRNDVDAVFCKKCGAKMKEKPA